MWKVSNQQSAISSQQSAVSRQQVQVPSQPQPQVQQSVISSQQSAISGQQSAVGGQQSAVSVNSQSQSQSQPTAVRVGRLGRPGTISITAEEPKKQEVVEEVWNNPFSQEQLTAAWNSFVDKHQNVSPVFVAGIKNAEPTISAPSVVTFSIDNILVVKDQSNMYALHEYLKNALHNNQFVLKEVVLEKPKEVVLYTDKQKFEKMTEDNPIVNDIKESLGLRLD